MHSALTGGNAGPTGDNAGHAGGSAGHRSQLGASAPREEHEEGEARPTQRQRTAGDPAAEFIRVEPLSGGRRGDRNTATSPSPKLPRRRAIGAAGSGNGGRGRGRGKRRGAAEPAVEEDNSWE